MITLRATLVGGRMKSSQYYDINKASLYITVLFRHSTLEVDRHESTEQEPKVIKEHVFVICDDPVH